MRLRVVRLKHISRRHWYELGADTALVANSASRIRGKLVDLRYPLLYPLGESFEDLGIDADHLFRRLNVQKRTAA
jgi:hypothetical protein